MSSNSSLKSCTQFQLVVMHPIPACCHALNSSLKSCTQFQLEVMHSIPACSHALNSKVVLKRREKALTGCGDKQFGTEIAVMAMFYSDSAATTLLTGRALGLMPSQDRNSSS
eukprot:11000009-Lingulodinium_polyedra.AAC.1